MVGISFIILSLGTLLLWRLGNAHHGFREYRRALSTGFPVIETPLAPIGLMNILALKFIIPILKNLPWTNRWQWLYIASHRNSFLNLRSSYDIHGDTYIFAASNLNLLRTTNAELIAQFTTRKNDFVKPVRNYKILEVFGSNIVTTEGEEWRRHKRIVGKSFGEKSMGLVWGESIKQVDGMLGLWRRRNEEGGKGGNVNGDMGLIVEDAGSDTAILSLHVICAVGFGVPQLWEGEEDEVVGGDEKIEGNGAPDLGLNKPVGDHTMGFKDCINLVLSSLILIVLWPRWVLKYSPMKRHTEVYKASKETTQYLTELLEHKKKQMEAGEHDKVTMDLMGNMLKTSTESPISYKSSQSDDAPLTEAEIKANAFIFLLAGHETTASSIHLCFVYLAISFSSQSLMQKDIDTIIGAKPPKNWSYMHDFPRLYNSMVGAVLNEELRLLPIAETIPKVTVGDQWVMVDGVEKLVPGNCFIHLNTMGTNRNPRYWPHEVFEGGKTDLDDFVPGRWIVGRGEEGVGERQGKMVYVSEDVGEEKNVASTPTLFKPVKGAFLSFSEGARACPGKKFAQVEITAVLAVIFRKFSVELDVTKWASDEELEGMSREEVIYEIARRETKEVLGRCNQAQLVLKMAAEDRVPLRFVERGGEVWGC
ncbi:d01caf92-2577-4233-b8db-222e299b72f9 [Sclerotinia trifoliorum]|uniref:D01caf92-2577-4233-b8db-222e299b72f9 n=1 Tax=Sclerotinia trifoliorum TaxID=28548 RepID=A0A8H2VZ40_9HELO|nr:d01caf92-2577-4233-b8db-222e299b72f9 [Sclerotinia trifoliorum]